MQLRFTLEEAKKKAAEYLPELHCGPTTLKVMWEAYGINNEDFLWAGTAFRGGIAGVQEGPCGAVSGIALAIALRHHSSITGKAKAEQTRELICKETAELVKSFKDKWGAISCLDLMGVDFNDKQAMEKARKSGTSGQNCLKQVQYAIELLYRLEGKPG
jgi:C_GCAxxG_C_C family probable redox protein